MTREDADRTVRQTPFGEFVDIICRGTAPEEEADIKRIVSAFFSMTEKENPLHVTAAMVRLTHLMLVESEVMGTPRVH